MERIDLLIEAVNKLGHTRIAFRWFRMPNSTLNGETPFDVMERGEMDAVKEAIDAIGDWDVFD